MCAAQFTRFEDAILNFRQSLSGYAERQATSRARTLTKPSFETPRRLAGAFAGVLAAAAVAAIVIVPTYWSSVENPPAPAAQADTELLDEVNMQLSRSVPMTLEPLMDLLAENESISDTDGGRP